MLVEMLFLQSFQMARSTVIFSPNFYKQTESVSTASDSAANKNVRIVSSVRIRSCTKLGGAGPR